MKRKLEVLLGLLLASALMLGGCVVSAPDGDGDGDDDVTVGEAKSALVSAPASNDPTHASGGDSGGSGSLAKPGAPCMGEPEPAPWKPPPSGPPADPTKEH